MENNLVCKVVGIATTKVKMFDNVVGTLKDVRHVPNLKKNLISLGTLDSNGFSYKSEKWDNEGIKGCYDYDEGTESR